MKVILALKLQETMHQLEIIKLCLIRANNEIDRLNLEVSRLRYEKRVYKVEMNRCRRKLEAVYKYCDGIMTDDIGPDWKRQIQWYRKKGWL